MHLDRLAQIGGVVSSLLVTGFLLYCYSSSRADLLRRFAAVVQRQQSNYQTGQPNLSTRFAYRSAMNLRGQ